MSDERGLNRPAVDIALAVYNGTRFLEPFLASIASQTYSNVTLVVSDDQSSDGTLDLIRSFGDRIAIRIVEEHLRLGVVRNFERALGACTAPYVALADQDDVWRADKIALLLDGMRAVEADAGADVPVLAFSDLALTDEQGSMVAPSFFDATVKSRRAQRFADFAFSNHVPGCATMLNRRLVDLVLPFPAVEIHDWWINLAAAAAGRLKYVPHTLVEYRQHAGNTIGISNATGSWYGKAWNGLRRARQMYGERRARASTVATTIRQLMLALDKRLNERNMTGRGRQLLALIETGDWLSLSCQLFPMHPGLRLADLLMIMRDLRRGVSRGAGSD